MLPRSLLVLSIALLVAVSACGGSSGSSTSTSPTKAAETPVKVATSAATATATTAPQPANTAVPEPTATTASQPGPPQPTQPPPPPAVNNNPTIRAFLLDFVPKTVTVKVGQPVAVTLQNDDLLVAHDLIFRVSGVSPDSLCTGVATCYTLSFMGPAPGSYSFYCSIHESSNMTGTLVVVP